MASKGYERQISKEQHEIIEFPFVLYDTQSRSVVSQQQNYVSPKHTKVTQFCENLTGITQAKLDAEGEALQDVVNRIEEALGDKDAVIMFDGNWDISILKKEFREKKVNVTNGAFWNRYFDLKREFRAALPVDTYPDSIFHPVPSLSFMKRYLGAQNSNLQAHVGIDDCLQIKEILEKLFARGHVLNMDSVIDYEESQDEFVTDFNYSFNVDNVTPESLARAMDFELEKDVIAIYRVDHVPNAKSADATFLFILSDSYKAQIFFLRANIAVMAYSKTLFEECCFRNVPTLLYAVRSSKSIKNDDERLFKSAAESLCYPRLHMTCSELMSNLSNEINRFHRQGKFDMAAIRLATLHAELSSAAQLAEIEWSAPWADSMQLLQPQIHQFLNLLAAKIVPLVRKKAPSNELAEHHTALGIMMRSHGEHSVLTAPPFASPHISQSMLNFESVLIDSSASKEVLAVVNPLDRPNLHHSSGVVIFQELADGVACTLWHDGKAWRALVDPSYFPTFPHPSYNYSSLKEDYSKVNKDMFWRIWKERNYKFPKETHYCFCFSMVFPNSGLVHCAEPNLIYEFAVDKKSSFAPVPRYLDEAEALSWKVARIGEVDYLAPPTRVRGAWRLHECGARFLEETPSYQCLRMLLVLSGGAYHPKAVELIVQLVLFVEPSAKDGIGWFVESFPKFAALWNQVNAWLMEKINLLNDEFVAARYLPRNAFFTATQGSRVKHWLHQMKNAGCDDGRSFLQQFVSMNSLAMTWKKESRK